MIRLPNHRYSSIRIWSASFRSISSINNDKDRLLILGTGWAGFNILRRINPHKYNVTVISNQNFFAFTPLLASTTVGTLEFRCITEAVRLHISSLVKQGGNATFKYATAIGVDFDKNVVKCHRVATSGSSNEGGASKVFTVPYDKLIISVGAFTNTFGITGADRYAYFLKSVHDAQRIRGKIIDCFEAANDMEGNEKEQRRLLHFVIVGGGPTGVEWSAELHDYINQDLSKIYPHLASHVSITLFDVGDRLLSSFDQRLGQYTSKKFSRDGITVRTQTPVTSVGEKVLTVGDGENVEYGMLVWSTGLAPNPFIKALESQVTLDHSKRVVTDSCLRVLQPGSSEPYPNIYALGDCSTISGQEHPATAQVAMQKGKYLATSLNALPKHASPFQYKHLGSMAYVGG